MIRAKILITLFAFATVIVAGWQMQGAMVALWSAACVLLGWALTELWKLKNVER